MPPIYPSIHALCTSIYLDYLPNCTITCTNVQINKLASQQIWGEAFKVRGLSHRISGLGT